jgi:hypothetical protein
MLNVLLQIANKMGLQKKSVSRLSGKYWSLDVSQTYGLPRPHTEIPLLLYLLPFSFCLLIIMV